MKAFKVILPIMILLCACDPTHTNSSINTDINMYYDSVFTFADIQWHKQYYPLLDRQVFSIDLLTEGLAFDSAYQITGTGINLYFSDIFLPITDNTLQDGVYHIDSTANAFTCLPYKYFEGNITGCYLLDIQEDKIQRIIGFTTGKLEITTSEDNIHLNVSLYTPDSTHYRATYDGPAMYR